VDNFDFVKDKYVQEELREKEAFPEGMDDGRAVALGLQQRLSPSVADIEEQPARTHNLSKQEAFVDDENKKNPSFLSKSLFKGQYSQVPLRENEDIPDDLPE
jgi:hypothetical protein